jgi:hypothetical protein
MKKRTVARRERWEEQGTIGPRALRIRRHFQPKIARIWPIRNGTQPGLRNGTEELHVVIIEVAGVDYVRTMPRDMCERMFRKRRR